MFSVLKATPPHTGREPPLSPVRAPHGVTEIKRSLQI